MASLNKVFLMGNLTRDPDLRGLPSGQSVCEFGLAITERYGEREETVFIDITCWGKTAEFCKNYLTKGSNVYIEGKLKLDTWEDRNGGGKRSKLSVTALTVQSLSRRQQEQHEGQGNNPNRYPQQNTYEQRQPYQQRQVSQQYSPPPVSQECPPFPTGDSDDDMPF
jgi:single-strand DNA-binding protein